MPDKVVATPADSRWELLAFAATVAMVAYAGLFVAWSQGLLDGAVHILSPDFVAFYSASWMALHSGDATSIWSLDSLFAVQAQLTGATDPVPWFYPPTFLLVILPVSLLPYLASVVVWALVTATAWIISVVKATTVRHSWWVILGFPGLWRCLVGGQNGLLTAAIIGFAAWAWAKDRTVLSGVLVGLLIIKPHLALGVAVALLAVQAWRAVAAAVITALGFLGLSTLVFGWQTVPAWLGSMSEAFLDVQTGALPWSEMPSVYASLRMTGMDHTPALAIYLVIAVAATIAVVLIARRTTDWRWLWGAGMVGVFLMLPYSYSYDLAWLLLPILWLAETPTSKPEKVLLATAWIAPLAATTISQYSPVPQLTPLVLVGLMWMLWRRAGAAGG